MHRHQLGFTLTELLIVLGIVAAASIIFLDSRSNINNRFSQAKFAGLYTTASNIAKYADFLREDRFSNANWLTLEQINQLTIAEPQWKTFATKISELAQSHSANTFEISFKDKHVEVRFVLPEGVNTKGYQIRPDTKNDKDYAIVFSTLRQPSGRLSALYAQCLNKKDVAGCL